MKLPPELQAEMQQLCWRLQNGQLSGAEAARLDRLVCEHLAARDWYVRYFRLCGGLEWEFREIPYTVQAASQLLIDAPRPVPPLQSRPDWLGRAVMFVNRPSVFSAIFATAALFAIVTLLGVLRFQMPVEPAQRSTAARDSAATVARITGTHNCRWVGNDASRSPSAALAAGEPLQLASGDVEILLQNQVRAILHGPARMRLRSAQRVELDAGSLSVTLPRAVRQFEVLTPTARIIDLGTQFAVEASAAQTELHVLAGRVRVEPRHSTAQAQVVTAGQAVQIGAEGAQLVSSVRFDAEQFIAALPIAAGDLPVTAGLRLWLDATDESTLELIGNEVIQWRDKSGGGNHARAVREDKRPLYEATALGGHAALAFNRDQLRIDGGLPTISGGQARTIFLVFDRTTVFNLNSNLEVFGTNTNTMIDVGRLGFDNTVLRLRDVYSQGTTGGEDGGGGIRSPSGSLPVGPRVVTVVASREGWTQAFSDGTLVLDTPDSYAHYPLDTNLGIGYALSHTRGLIGNLAEVIVYNRALQPGEVQVVTDHLLRKYHLPTRQSRKDAAGPSPL